jgi:hypothetical protein
MTTYTWSELGEAADGYIRGAAQAVRNLWCDTVAKAPGYLVNAGFDIGLNQYFDQLFRNACANRPGNPTPIPAPKLPATGGQCDNVLYRINLQGIRGIDGVPIGTGDQYYFGPITGPYVARGIPGAPGAIGWWIVAKRESGGDLVPIPVLFVGINDWPGSQLTSVVIQRRDGLPDTCGNQPVRYPQDNAPQNVTNIFNTNIVNISGGPALPALTVPLIFAPILIKPNLTIKADVQIKGKIGDFNFRFGPEKLSINPSIKANFYLPGQNVYFDTPPYEEPGPDDYEPPLILPELDDIKACACKAPPTDTVTVTGSGNAGILICPSGYIPLRAYVKVRSRPRKIKVQLGGQGGVDVTWQGWYRWGDAYGWANRHYFDADSCSIWNSVKDGWDRFTWTTYAGGISDAYLICIKA